MAANPTTTLSYHVAGAIIPACTVGSAAAYANIGICEDGADIDIQIAAHDIKDDGGGGPDGFEVENIFLNAIATVRFTLVPFAGTYVNRLRARAQAIAGDTDGVLVAPGTLYGMNSLLVGLQLPSNDGDGSWRFPTCRVVRPGSNRVSTKESKLQFEFRAFGFLNPAVNTTISGVSLYTRY